MRKKLLSAIILGLLVNFGCTNNPLGPQNKNRPILFVSVQGAKMQIYSMNEDGSNITKLSQSSFNNYNPRWSKDGQTIVFNSSGRSSNIHYQAIVKADANGIHEHVLLEHGLSPVFSPEGDEIVFSYDTLLPGFGSPLDIVLYDLEKDKATLFKEDTSFSDIIRDWSPDGRYLLVNSNKGTTNRKLVQNIYSIDLVDSSRTKLTEGPISYFGRFSPDGQSIVYVHKDTLKSTSFVNVRNVYIMNYDGSGKRNITNSDTLSALNPVWSPDGTKIIYINYEGSNQRGNRKYNIYSINTDGTGIIQLTKENDQVEPTGLDWRSP